MVRDFVRSERGSLGGPGGAWRPHRRRPCPPRSSGPSLRRQASLCSTARRTSTEKGVRLPKLNTRTTASFTLRETSAWQQLSPRTVDGRTVSGSSRRGALPGGRFLFDEESPPSDRPPASAPRLHLVPQAGLSGAPCCRVLSTGDVLSHAVLSGRTCLGNDSGDGRRRPGLSLHCLEPRGDLPCGVTP